ncbi:hypothetical protein D3C72_1472080 [compost metagenome]
MRVAKPHSLSYQVRTRASLPSTTCVWGRAAVEEAAMWFRSMETSGSVVVARTPFMAPSAAACRAALISSTVTSRPATTFRSTTETFGVGTRIDEPSSLPFSSGRTRPRALAAPVEVGIIDRPAARPRYGSLCIVSSVGWSPV